MLPVDSYELLAVLADRFNKDITYNSQNITVNLNTFSLNDDIKVINTYDAMMSITLGKKIDSYDLYVYGNQFTSKYSRYFQNLSNFLPKEHVDMYDKNIINRD
eukprot:jgi/Orpsp1_1/1188981/evm.model.d7180000068652.1